MVGQIVLHKDKKITSEDIMLLAAVGITKVEALQNSISKILAPEMKLPMTTTSHSQMENIQFQHSLPCF